MARNPARFPIPILGLLLLALPLVTAAIAAPQSAPALTKGFHTASYTVLGGMTRREESFQRAEAGREPDRVMLRPTGATGETQALVVYKPSEPKVPFRDVLVSWNCDAPKGSAVVVELRVARGPDDADWSPWMLVGTWGDVADPDSAKAVSACEGGRIEEGIFLGDADFTRVQARLRGLAASATPKREIVATQLVVQLRNRTRPTDDEETGSPKAIELKVPHADLGKLEGEGADLVACVRMLLASRGVEVPVKRVAELVVVPGQVATGARGVQAAHVLGVTGNLTCTSNWGKVDFGFSMGYAPAIRIQAAAGELKGAPEGANERRWIVLVGIDEKGDCLVRDPGAPDAGKRLRTYSRADLERVWMAHGGTTIVLNAPRKPAKGK